MMEDVLDAFLFLLAGEPVGRFVAVGVAEDGRELRAAVRVDHVASVECRSVQVEVPDAPRGRAFVVLSRWSDDDATLAYASPRDGCEMPRWKHMELVPDGVRLSVHWPREGAPRVHEFRWLTRPVPPVPSR